MKMCTTCKSLYNHVEFQPIKMQAL